MNDDRVLLFDLGGVLVDASGHMALAQLVPQPEDLAATVARWHESKAVGLFERGRIAPSEFAEMFVAEWGLALEPPEFLGAFAGWVRGFYPGAKALVGQLRTRYTVACLSNTNAAHWARLAEVRESFDVCLPSHMTGHMKPDRAAYEHALRLLGVPAARVCFFDDQLPNVVAAREAGFNAFHVRGVRETEDALRSAGFSIDAVD
jgi:glucose-1-phosphatase